MSISEAGGITPRIEFGVENEQYLPLHVISEVRQVRTGYDAEAIAELARSIPVIEAGTNSLQFELINPPTVARFDEREGLWMFLGEHARYYDEPPIKPSDLTVWNDAWHIRVNGHRRARAVEQICTDHSIDTRDVLMVVKVLDNPTFEEVRRNQYLENKHEKPSSVDEAQQIEREFRYRKLNDGSLTNASTITTVAEYFGHSRDKVRDALHFMTVPEDIREFCGHGLSYGNIIELAKLRDEYAKKLSSDENSGDDKMRWFFETTVFRRLQGASTKQISRLIDAKIRELRLEGSWQTDELFAFDVETEQRRAKNQLARDLGDLAVLTLNLKKGDLTPEHIAALERIVKEAKSSVEEA